MDAVLIAEWCLQPPGPQETLLGRMLANAEAQASTAEGAGSLLGDSKALATILEALRRPASGSLYTQWAGSSELKRAARAGARLLQHCSHRKEAAGLQRAIIAAAHAALPIQPETTAAVADALSQAEREAAGELSTRCAIHCQQISDSNTRAVQCESNSHMVVPCIPQKQMPPLALWEGQMLCPRS